MYKIQHSGGQNRFSSQNSAFGFDRDQKGKKDLKVLNGFQNEKLNK